MQNYFFRIHFLAMFKILSCKQKINFKILGNILDRSNILRRDRIKNFNIKTEIKINIGKNEIMTKEECFCPSKDRDIIYLTSYLSMAHTKNSHTSTYAHILTHTYSHTHKYTRTRTHTHKKLARTHTHTHTHTHILTHAHALAHILSKTRSHTHTHTYSHAHAHIHTKKLSLNNYLFFLSPNTYFHSLTLKYTHTHMYRRFLSPFLPIIRTLQKNLLFKQI